MIRKVERKIKAKYRKMCGWCFLIALIIGFVLGFLSARMLFPAKQGQSATPAPTPVVAAPAPQQTEEAQLVAPTQEPTPVVTEAPTPTPVPTPTPTPTVDPIAQLGSYFGLSAEDLGVTQTPVSTPTPTPTPEPTPLPTPTQQVVQVVPTATPTSALLTITPTPAAVLPGTDAQATGAEQGAVQTVQGTEATQNALPTQTEQPQQVVSGKGSKADPYLLDEVFTFDTEVLPSGLPRTNVADTQYDTVRFSISLNNYMTPDYYKANYGDKYRLTGTEAGAKLTMSFVSSTGTAAIAPQDALRIVFENEAGMEVDGYQLINAEIAGLSGITIQPGQTQVVYKRFVYNDLEDMRYLVVKYYVGGQEQKAYFKLEVGEPTVNYDRLSSGSRGDAVQALQERLVELGYLDDKADGIFGGNTTNAIRDAQEQAGMEVTGVADNAFQQYIFSSSAQAAN